MPEGHPHIRLEAERIRKTHVLARQGGSYRSIAKAVGSSPATVMRDLKKRPVGGTIADALRIAAGHHLVSIPEAEPDDYSKGWRDAVASICKKIADRMEEEYA